jgi:hypothetical protein
MGQPQRSRRSDHLQVSRHCKAPVDVTLVNDEDIDRAGLNNSCGLVRLTQKGKLSLDGVDGARKKQCKSFGPAVERVLGRGANDPDVGEFLDPSFRGLSCAPTSEQGVVYGFGMVSSELGFRVEAVHRDYPDCIAKREVSDNPARWRTVRIEFEYKRSNFYHPPEGSDLIGTRTRLAHVGWQGMILVQR